jgi:hypothetical protein
MLLKEGLMKSIVRCAVLACIALAAPLGVSRAQVIYPLSDLNLDLSQVDFTYASASQSNSAFGLLTATNSSVLAASGGALSSGYVNIYNPSPTHFTSDPWLVRNMPIDPLSGYAGISTMFDLGNSPGAPVAGLDLIATLSDQPLLTPPVALANPYVLTRVEHNAEGGGGPGAGGAEDSPRTAPPDPTNRANTAAIAYNAGMPPVAGVTWQPGHPNIEQAINQCGPAAIANSLQWLENSHSGLAFPDPHVSGQNDNDSMVGKIDQSAERPNDKYTASAKKFMQGKLDYIDDSNQESKLKIKHKERTGINWLGATESSPDGNAKSTEDATQRSLMEWILDELRDGEDVEIRIGWDNGGGHFVDLIGGGTIFGVPWIAWAHDAEQGKAGGTGWLDGGVVWTPVVGDANRIVNYAGGKVFFGTVDFAASESFIPEPSGAILACCGIAAITHVRRRGRRA